MLEITQNSSSSSSSSSRRTVILSLCPSAHIWTPRSDPCAVMQAVSWRGLRPPCVFVLLLCKAAVRPSRRLMGPVLALMEQVRPGLLSATCSPAVAAAMAAWRGSFACEVCVREDGCPPSQVTLTHFLCYHEAAGNSHTFLFSRPEHRF